MGMKSGNITTFMLPDVRQNWARLQESVERYFDDLKRKVGSKDNRNYFGIILLNH
jgi:hypothetical protein